MADTITDTRTLIDDAESATGYVDLSLSAAGSLDNEVFIENANSIGEDIGSTLKGIMWDDGAVNTAWANSVFYIRINCGIVGVLDTKANGGFRIRFAATATSWFEVYVGGSDSWPTAIAGGWVTFVVDIELARSTAVTNGWVGTTTPATNACQYVGWAGITGGTMPRKVDNTWLDASYYLPDGNAGILIQGKSGGTTAWTFEDIFTQLGNSAGVFVPAAAGGAYVCNTPIEIGQDDAVDHALSDTNAIVLWADQEFAPADLYGITVTGAVTGTVDVDMGVKSGTGDDATGAQGCTIAAGAAEVRWFFDASGADIDSVNLMGCTFIHGAAFSLGAAHVETIGTNFLDCESAVVTGSLFQRCKVLEASTADGVAFCTTDDLTDIRFCEFTFSDGHAVGLVTPQDLAQESRGNKFTSYLGTPGTNAVVSSGSTDAAIYNNQGDGAPTDDVVIAVTNSGDTMSIRNGADITTTVNNDLTITIDTDGITNFEARVFLQGTTTVVSETQDNGATDTWAFTVGSAVAVDIVIMKTAAPSPQEYFRKENISFSTTSTFAVTLRLDKNSENYIP